MHVLSAGAYLYYKYNSPTYKRDRTRQTGDKGTRGDPYRPRLDRPPDQTRGWGEALWFGSGTSKWTGEGRGEENETKTEKERGREERMGGEAKERSKQSQGNKKENY